MSASTCPENAAFAARQINGATIAWGGGRVYDFTLPNPHDVTLEDAAYALAYTVRWRGQARTLRWIRLRRFFDLSPARAVYGVAQHCVFGTEEMMKQDHDRADCLGFLFHEPDEIVLPDMPGPVKPLIPGWRELAGLQGDAFLRRFRIPEHDVDLVKRIDLRMMVTEKRDLMHGHEGDFFQTSAHAPIEDTTYWPFDRRIIPHRHPDKAARRFVELYRKLAA